MQLSEIIIERIQKEGPISFRDFMETALYYPKLGYYNNGKNKIGADGDFYTSANLTEAFGAMIGRQFEEMWINLDKKPFTIVEYGAGTGLLCNDILNYLKKNDKMYNSLSYCIIEKSSSFLKIQKKHLKDKVAWYDSILEIPKITGCVFSNEVIDNFAVHQVIMKEHLHEVYIDYKHGFVEILIPAKKELIDYFNILNVQLPFDFRTEINLGVKSWLREISQSIKKGYLLTIDYGGLSKELYKKKRSCGTLICYSKHHRNDNPYQYIGKQDITTHVNFSALDLLGKEFELDSCGYVNQAQFLLGLGIKEYQDAVFSNKPVSLKSLIQESIINYRLLVEMGTKIKVLIQRKEAPRKPLSGLKHLYL
jgi:SAM-dependent MidA family methyltransferase